MKSEKRKLLVGGTHGNEWTGIHLLEYFKDKPCYSDSLLANPKAFELSKRFVDEDLNRCFSEEKRSSQNGIYERQRAAEIFQDLGSFDLVVDLHTTTSNMKSTVIFCEKKPEVFKVLNYVAEKDPTCKFLFNPDPDKQYMISHAKLGLVIEVGPVANSALKADVFEASKNLAKWISEASDIEGPTEGSLEYYQYEKKISYQYKDGALFSMVHEDIQDKDFIELKQGQALLQDFHGKPIYFDDIDGLYPIFINEAAYYNYEYAMQLVSKKNWKA